MLLLIALGIWLVFLSGVIVVQSIPARDTGCRACGQAWDPADGCGCD